MNSIFPENPVLVIDDNNQDLTTFNITLKTRGITNVLLCQDSRKAADLAASAKPLLVLLDLEMPHINGEELLPVLMQTAPTTPIIVATGTSDLATALRCMKAGAYDYLVKPVSKERLLAAAKHAIRVKQLQNENARLRKGVLSVRIEHAEAFSGFTATSEKMTALFKYAESIAPSSNPVLITGETGVGKEIMANAIHKISGRQGRFVPVNVAGLDDDTFSDTLFGHVKGAYTGAINERKGALGKARGGTLFLDEIGDLSLPLQVKLLRLLQEGEYSSLGSDVLKKTNARIVVATNKPVDCLRESENFRNDLFYRLCHHHVHIPPLRERLADLPALLEALISSAAREAEKKIPSIPPELPELLSTYTFPGNVRELKAMVTDAIHEHRHGVLSLRCFRNRIKNMSSSKQKIAPHLTVSHSMDRNIAFKGPLPTLNQLQEIMIEEALKRADGNQSAAAEMLGMTRQALNKRLLNKKK